MRNDHGSIESALEGDYHFSIRETISEAWERTSGAKLMLLGAMFVYVVIAVITQAVTSLFFNTQHYYDAQMYAQAFASDQAQSLLALPIITPLLAGLMILGIRRACGHEIRVSSIFDYYVIVWPLVFTAFFMNLFIIIGFVLLILPGIYLSIAYMFALPLVAEKRLGVFEAMEVSRKAVTKRWFSFFFYNLAVTFIIIISALPLGIGLIWTIPMALIGYGILYRTLFGYVPVETAEDTGTPDVSQEDHDA